MVENVLVVEDEDDWRDIYTRNIEGRGGGIVRSVGTLQEAREALAEVSFALAFIDINLDTDDDGNRDGLEVMGMIADLDEGTAMVMVTSREKVIVTRDALKKYGAVDAVDKSIRPRELRELREAALAEYELLVATKRPPVLAELNGDVERDLWDWRMMETIGVSGGIQRLFDVGERALTDLWPLVPRDPSSPLTLSQEGACAFGEFWSRGLGHAVAVWIGNDASLAPHFKNELVIPTVLQRREGLGSLVRRATVPPVTALVFALEGVPRNAFPFADGSERTKRYACPPSQQTLEQRFGDDLNILGLA